MKKLLFLLLLFGCEKPEATMLKVLNTDTQEHRIEIAAPKYAYYQDSYYNEVIPAHTGKDFILRHGEYQIFVEWIYTWEDITDTINKRYDITVWDNIFNTFNIPISRR